MELWGPVSRAEAPLGPDHGGESAPGRGLWAPSVSSFSHTWCQARLFRSPLTCCEETRVWGRSGPVPHPRPAS